jgi:hypothetical protein
MSKAIPAIVSTDMEVPERLNEQIENLGYQSLPKLALLIRWFDAETSAHRGGTHIELEQLAWRGAEDLCRDVFRQIERVQRSAGMKSTEGLVLLAADDEGGAR